MTKNTYKPTKSMCYRVLFVTNVNWHLLLLLSLT